MDEFGYVELRGVSTGGAVVFEWAVASPGGEHAPRRIPGAGGKPAGPFMEWRATVEDALPGQTYSIRMTAAEDRSAAIEFHMPAVEPDAITPIGADVIGNTAAVLAARVAPVSPGARWRFEYGPIPGAQDMAIGLCWSQAPPGVAPPQERICWPVGGGVQDLRDTEITFTLCGQNLEQHGAALHF